MPEVLDFVNGKPVRRGTDSSADLLPTVSEEQAKPKPKPKPKGRAKPKPKPKGFLEQLQNDITYEFNQARKDPVRSVMRAVGNAAPMVAGTALGMRSPVGTPKPGFLAGAGAADTAMRMGYSAIQRMTGAKQADPSRGAFGEALDSSIDMIYRLAGGTPPSQQTRLQRDVDMMGRDVAATVVVGRIPFLGARPALGAATKLGKLVKGGLSFAGNEALAQLVTDNTGGGFSDLVNMALPKDKQMPGGIGSRAGKLDMIDAAGATFGGNVAGSMAIGGTLGLASRLPGLANKLFPGTSRWQRGNRAKAEEVEARGRLTAAGVQEDNGDGAFRPGPAVATAAPQKPATFAEADAQMRARLGEKPEADPVAAELDQVNQRIAELDQQTAQTVEDFGKAQPAELPDDFDPDLDPWNDFDPKLPEATDVLKTLDQLDPAVIRQMDEADGSITEMVQQAQQAQGGFQLNPNMRFDQVAAPTDKLGRLYLEGSGEIEGWDRLIESETVKVDALRSLAHPSNSPELTAKIEALTGKEWEEFTVGDIREGLRAMSREGRTVIAERLSGQEFMATFAMKRDPVRFQYKGGINAKGEQVGASLSDEEFWNPKAEGVLEVWDDPADLETYVGNGHNRLALAEKLGIPSLPITRVVATKASAARAFGAISNIAQGQGNAFDAAKFIRESGINTPQQLKQAGMTGERSWAKDGLALSKLPDDLFKAAVDDEISLRKAVIIGESGLPEPGMRMLAAEVRNNPNIPDWELKEIGTMTGSSPAVKSRQGTLEGMEGFGIDEGGRQKIRLVRLVEEALRKDAKDFGGVAKAAGRLEGKAANTIDRAGSKAVAEESSSALADFTRLKYQTGEVSDRLNRAAQQIADGEQPGAVARQVADEMPAILQREMDNAMGRPQAAEVPEVDPDQVDLFAPPEQAADVVPPPETAAQIEARKMRIVGRALKDGEARPNTTPIPELSEAPRVDPSEALADIAARGGIEPDSPAMRAMEDELRLVEEQALSDAAARQDAIDTMKDAYGYDELTFEEKKALGMADGWEDDLTPMTPIEDMPKIADMVDRANAEMAQTDARVYRRVGESIGTQRQGLDQLGSAPGRGLPDQIRTAALKATGGKFEQRVYVADIREALPGVSPEELDRVLIEMDMAREVQLMSIETPSEVTPRDAAAAVRIAGQPHQLLYLTNRPAPTQGLAPAPMKPEPDVMPTTVMGQEPPKRPLSDKFGKLIDQMVDTDRRTMRVVGELMDDTKRMIDELAPGENLAAKPVRPEPLRLTASPDQPAFALPEELSKTGSRYGRFVVKFESDLDRVAYTLQNDGTKAPSKSAGKYRAAVEAAGLNPAEVVAHGKRVKAALKEAARGSQAAEIRLPAQPWADAAPPAAPIPKVKVDAEIAAIDSQITDLQQRLNKEGC